MANDNTNSVLYWYKPYYINFSLLIMSVGFLFKVSAAPFHFDRLMSMMLYLQ
jgi:NADH-ubiquinone oxidoreductase chain 2